MDWIVDSIFMDRGPVHGPVQNPESAWVLYLPQREGRCTRNGHKLSIGILPLFGVGKNLDSDSGLVQ